MNLLDYISLPVALLSVVATGLAAFATWRAPLSAAAYSEALRNASEAKTQRLKAKREIFFILMRERAAFYSLDGVKALNSIDVVFHDVKTVREAWSSLFLSYDKNNSVPEHAKKEMQVALLMAIAENIGLSENLRSDDFSRIYYPESIAQEEQYKNLQRKIGLKDLKDRELLENNSASTSTSLYPPKPDS